MVEVMNQKSQQYAEVCLRLALVDDCELVRAGLAALLKPYAPRVELVDSTSSGEVDVVLFDPLSPPQARRADLRHWTSRGTRVLVYSWDVRSAVRQAGALQPVGYLSKRAPAEMIVRGLESAARGDLSGAANPNRLRMITENQARTLLTVRESEVLSMIVQGLSNDEICRRDYVTNNTLKSHIRNLYRKIGVTRRSQAVLWGAQNGYLPPPRAAASQQLSRAL